MRRRGVIATSVCRKPGFAADSEMDRLFEQYYGPVSGLLDELECAG